MQRIVLIASNFAIILATSGCATSGPQPPAPFMAPTQFKEDGLWKRATPGSSAVPQAWWQLFDDPVLDTLQRRLVIGNENLKAAVAQVASARVALHGSEAVRLPSLSLGAGAARGSSSGSAGGGSNTGSLTGSSAVGSTYSLSATAGWEADLWGRLSLATQAAGATLQASEDDLAAARLSAQATLAQTYLAMRAAEAQQALLERTVDANRRVLQVTRDRQRAGAAALGDVLQAQTQLKTVQVQLEESKLQRAQSEHAIAVLLGQPPSAVSITSTAELPTLPPVPVLLPSTLLERRPDIAAAERRVVAAYAQIGVADAAYFPDLTLSGSAGYRAASLRGLFDAPTLLWSLGSSLAVAVFDGGVRQQASDQARALADEATASYRQTVLTALQEVEDNLVVLDRLEIELQLQREALVASQRNLEIVQDQYKAGTVGFLNVATAQTATLSAEANVVTLRNRQLVAASILLKNIGGRWQDDAAAGAEFR